MDPEVLKAFMKMGPAVKSELNHQASRLVFSKSHGTFSVLFAWPTKFGSSNANVS